MYQNSEANVAIVHDLDMMHLLNVNPLSHQSTTLLTSFPQAEGVDPAEDLSLLLKRLSPTIDVGPDGGKVPI